MSHGETNIWLRYSGHDAIKWPYTFCCTKNKKNGQKEYTSACYCQEQLATCLTVVPDHFPPHSANLCIYSERNHHWQHKISTFCLGAFFIIEWVAKNLPSCRVHRKMHLTCKKICGNVWHHHEAARETHCPTFPHALSNWRVLISTFDLNRGESNESRQVQSWVAASRSAVFQRARPAHAPR